MKQELSQLGFEPLDWHLAKVLSVGSPQFSKNIELAILLASKRCREGHVCVSLAEVAALPLSITEAADEPAACALNWPPLGLWLEELTSSDLVSHGTAHNPLRPLVLHGDRLYLTRYYLHELALAQRIRERVSEALVPANALAVRGEIEHLCEPLHPDSEHQRLALAIAIMSRLALITGGPGTGKTTTIVKLLAVLLQQALDDNAAIPRVMLLAPTGKAATRIAESIRLSKQRLDASEAVKAAIPDAASTIHRALGVAARPDCAVNKQLAADIVIVDEASMVDLALMRRLFDACANVKRLVLLGDAEQLESVLAGSVLSELTAARHTGYCHESAQWLTQMTGLEVPSRGHASRTLDDCRIELTVSHRFASKGGVGRLAQAVRAGNGSEVLDIVRSAASDVRFVELSQDDARDAGPILDVAEVGYRRFRAAATPKEAVDALMQFRVLCAHRRGPLGIEAINRLLVERHRARHCPIPILITENSPEVSLYNGDMGVLWPEADSSLGQQAHVRSADGELRSFSLRRLPAFELAFATTVHKSQGSEVNEVAFVLPGLNSPLLTRELLYTAITRARTHCTIFGTKEALVRACERKSRRLSGLAAQLRGDWLP